jgi:hypothetical protein
VWILHNTTDRAPYPLNKKDVQLRHALAYRGVIVEIDEPRNLRIV